ncbi:MAG: aspartate aminotransferase family protein [Nitrospirae bacterium]|nr:aspartate aminotransferase family protein [Nitrospirota bacterium]
MLTEEIQLAASQYLMNTYARLPLSIVRGKGSKVYDSEGREYLDCVAGIAVNILGHGHPELVTAIERQARQLIHTSNLYYTEPQVRLAQLLVTHSFAQKVFFGNSGAEANEAAIKLARRYATQKFGEARHEIITFRQSFHGRTMATLTATGQTKVQLGFAPLLPGFYYATFNDWASVESVLTDNTAAIMIELIQGEGGVQVVDRDFLHQLRQLCTERDILLVFDEIQTGMGRTGTLFAYEHYGIEPDIMTLAKGLGGGFPIGACLATDDIARAFEPGSHASTFGGNPLACSAAIAVLEVLLNGELEKSRLIGAYLQKGLLELQTRNALIQEVRGQGLLQGLQLSIEGQPIVQDCQARRVLINCTMDRVLRLVPPLIITQPEIDLVLTVLSDVLNKRL